MNKTLRIVSALALMFAAFACAPKPTAVATVEPYAEGKPYTRWWWFAEHISREDVRYQLELLKEQGFGGV